MRVLVTAVKNKPSKRTSRLIARLFADLVRGQRRWFSVERCEVGHDRRLGTTPKAPNSPDSDIDIGDTVSSATSRVFRQHLPVSRRAASGRDRLRPMSNFPNTPVAHSPPGTE